MAAFVGHSGAGKSTIINLIPRFYDPQDGSIEIDSQDIKNVSLVSLRKNLSMVSQRYNSFDDTIKTIFHMQRQCYMIKFYELVNLQLQMNYKKTPKGYDTVIGENGIRLSGGQNKGFQ